jgi:BirA family biotin operon repressor/biotin-[acetyl-CoA-carboxylase] ligase
MCLPENFRRERKMIKATHQTFGVKRFFYEKIDSTNTQAKRLLKKNPCLPEGTVILAREQTRGHGRRGRKWFSPPGGLYLSLILYPKLNLKYTLYLTFISALSATETIEKLYPLKVLIKWPNDLILDHRKLGGILTEVEEEKNLIKYAIVGIGINLEKISPPPQISTPITSIEEGVNQKINHEEFIEELLKNYEKKYLLFQQKGPEMILEKVKSFSYELGKLVKVRYNHRILEGYADDLDETGALLLRTESGLIQPVSAGEVECLSV